MITAYDVEMEIQAKTKLQTYVTHKTIQSPTPNSDWVVFQQGREPCRFRELPLLCSYYNISFPE